MVGIYMLTNTFNNKVYIGQSVNIQKRLNAHKTHTYAPNSKEYSTYFHKEVRKFCKNKEEFSKYIKPSILIECERGVLNQWEIYFINKYHATDKRYGYNLAAGGQNSNVPPPFLEELYYDLLNTKISNIDLGNKYGLSDQSISDVNTGKCWYDDRFQYPLRNGRLKKLSKAHCPIMRTEDIISKEKVQRVITYCNSFTQMARELETTVRKLKRLLSIYGFSTNSRDYRKIKNNSCRHVVKKKIRQLSLDNQEIAIYNSLHDAAKTGLSNPRSRQHITEVCNKKRHSAYGFIWEFVEE